MRQLTPEEKIRIRRALEDFSQTVHLQSTEELHLFAERWNWDDYADPLFPIIRNPQCDKATALYLYWLTDPVGFFERYANEEEVKAGELESAVKYELGYFRLISEIQERFVSGFYTQETISLNPEKIANESLTSDELKIEIPDVMRQPTKGEHLPEDTFRFFQEAENLSPEVSAVMEKMSKDVHSKIVNYIESGQTFMALQVIRQVVPGLDNETAYNILNGIDGQRRY